MCKVEMYQCRFRNDQGIEKENDGINMLAAIGCNLNALLSQERLLQKVTVVVGWILDGRYELHDIISHIAMLWFYIDKIIEMMNKFSWKEMEYSKKKNLTVIVVWD